MKLIYTLLVAAMIASPVVASDLHKIEEPTESQGVSLEVLEMSDLAEQIPTMEGYDIRARRITFAAGASFTKHSHAIRPGFVYVESGEIIESRGGVNRKYVAGQTWYENAATDHWLRNVSDKPAVLIMVDLPVQE